MQDSASVCVHPDTISGTHDVNNVLKKLEVQETSIQESKPNDGGSSLRGLAVINTNAGCGIIDCIRFGQHLCLNAVLLKITILRL